jgi:WD40 repeat protein/serine/threonine protein kinase
MERCPTTEQLQDFLADRLPADSVPGVESHVEACAGCQQKLDQLMADSLSFRSASIESQTQRVSDPAEKDRAFLRQLAAKSVDMTWRGPGAAEDKKEVISISRREMPPAPPPVVGYRVLEVLGRGGMGVVYRAEHIRLKRMVALKMILSAGHAAESDLVRFRIEAEASARLQHPNIVQVFEVGEQDGHPYLALEFINGGSLAELVRKVSMTPRQSAQLIEVLSRAIQHAHQHGIIHRDLKPSNILLQRIDGKPSGENTVKAASDTLIVDEELLTRLTPKITDFGLAKLTEGDLNNTQSGSILGTPAYMSPEQADGRIKDIGIGVDIYALGCMLYELLTGKPPFRGETIGDVLQQVMTKEPTPPHRIRSQVPHDLSIICLKCLEKDPKQRYASAADLAEDLRRFLAGEPIMARPHSFPGIAWKWARRKPAGAALVIVLILATVGLIAGDLRYQSKLKGLLGQVIHERDEASKARDDARDARVDADRKRIEAEEQRDQSQQNLYLAHIPLAQRAWDAAHVARMRDLLEDVRPRDSSQRDLRNFEWYYLDRLTRANLLTLAGHASAVMTAAFHPTGKLLASASVDGMIKLWDPSTGQELSPLLDNHSERINSLAFSPDKKLLASAGADRVVRIWDLKTHKMRHMLKGHTGWVYHVAFSPDGKRLASCSADKSIKIWSLETSQVERTLTGHEKQVTGVAFGPDGKTLASCGADWLVGLWNVEGKSEPRFLKGHTGWVFCVAFSPDGKTVVSSSFDNTIRYWNVADGKERPNAPKQAGRVRYVAFSPDGSRLASAGSDQTVRIWDVQKAEQIQVIRGHMGNVNCVTFHPDGRRVVSASDDRTVKIWDSTKSQEFSIAQKHASGSIEAMAFSPDGKHLVSGGTNRVLYSWDMLKWTSEQPYSGNRTSLHALAFSPNSKLLASGGIDKIVRIWDVECRQTIQNLEGHTNRITAFAFSPDSAQLASCSYDATIKIWNVADDKEIQNFTNPNSRIMSIAYSPDGKTIASVGEDRAVRIWDLTTGTNTLTFTGHTDWVYCVAFHPSGKLVASGSADGTIKIWDLSTSQMQSSLEGHSGRVNNLAFNRDGSRLASGGFADGTVKIWDVSRGQELLSLNNQCAVHVVAFGVDDGLLASGGADGVVRIWDARPVDK